MISIIYKLYDDHPTHPEAPRTTASVRRAQDTRSQKYPSIPSRALSASSLWHLRESHNNRGLWLYRIRVASHLQERRQSLKLVAKDEYANTGMRNHS